MRVTCPECAESYSVSDEKLGGRVVKIRCRRCQTPIVLDGRSSLVPGSDTPLGAQPPLAPTPGKLPATSAFAALSVPAPTVSVGAPQTPSWDTPAPSLNRRPFGSVTQANVPPATLGNALLAPGGPPKARALIESIDIELEEEEVPPTARSSQFPEPPRDGPPNRPATVPVIPMLQPVPGQRRPAEPPPLPGAFQPPFGPFSPTPSSGNAFPWLQSGAPAPADAPPLRDLSRARPGSASSSSTSTQTLKRLPSDLPHAFSAQRGVFGAPTEDEETVAMSHQELMAAADASSGRRPLPSRVASQQPARAPATSEAQEPTDEVRMGPRLASLLFVGVALGAGCVWLKGHVWPDAAPATVAPVPSVPSEPGGNLRAAKARPPSPDAEAELGDVTRAAERKIAP